MEASNFNAIDDPVKLYDHTVSTADAMRQKLSKAIILQKAEATDLAISDPVLTTYDAVSHCNYMPEFINLLDEYLERGFNLQFLTGINIRSPGKVVHRLPMNDALVIPVTAIQHVRASVVLQRVSLI
ncbi:MAG: hypothetical protein EON60_05925 [Alphaproteobacteria bacterium]|nr:MAG: hypothetical protein EON60_05925 [Alphaproteobacteria bacterium]